MVTPLYQALKNNGTSFYCFPSAANDISSAYQNDNFKMYFSNFTLLNFPKQNLLAGTSTQSKPVYFDFGNDFQKASNAIEPQSYGDQLIESLRNYVANEEVTIMNSLLNNTDYYYDNTQPYTTTEKIFWKWCKKLNVIGFEPAVPGDQYFSNLSDFQSNSVNDPTYFPEYLWQERQVIAWDIDVFMDGSAYQNGMLQVQFAGTTNFVVGDIVSFTASSNLPIINGMSTTVLQVIPAGATYGQSIIVNLSLVNDLSYPTLPIYEPNGTSTLVYNRLVQYMSEITGVNNVQQANMNYTEVHAMIPDQNGQTPDILFRLMDDTNYKPNLTFPILPSQYQPEIVGAQLYNSPIVSSPQNYPGSYYGQFDNIDFTYETSNGDSLRRSGDYYGISGDLNNPVTNNSNIDGITLDWNHNHYVKMNITGNVITTFDQFDAMPVNNNPPTPFEFNAVLWYYSVEDSNGNVTTNLYGISFLDNPNNNPNPNDVGLQLPPFQKLVTNGVNDGTAYSFSLSLSFNVDNSNPVDVYNPSSINSLYSMSNFNTAMTRLAATNDSFLNILANQTNLQNQLNSIQQLLYTQTDINVINSQISNLQKLLTLYSTNQLVSSPTIEVVTSQTNNFSSITLNSIDSSYNQIDNIRTTDMYSANGIIPIDVNVPTNKDFLIHVTNNDNVLLNLNTSSASNNLTVLINRDLDYLQSCHIIVDGNTVATQNKMLDIYINYSITNTGTSSIQSQVPVQFSNNLPTATPLITDIDLPVYYNISTQQPNISYKSKDFKFEIDLNSQIILKSGGILQVPLTSNFNLVTNSINSGDVLVLNDFQVGTVSVFDFSGQYPVKSIDSVNPWLYLDVTSNQELVSYGGTNVPLTIHNGTASTQLSNIPYFSLNKGYKFIITRINDSDSSVITDRYLIEKEYLD